jgi:hypothetical protein
VAVMSMSADVDIDFVDIAACRDMILAACERSVVVCLTTETGRVQRSLSAWFRREVFAKLSGSLV